MIADNFLSVLYAPVCLYVLSPQAKTDRDKSK